jgi:lipopolysaccharide export system ATP-binding protein
MSVLEVQGLEKTYGRRRVVSGVSMRVEESEIVGLLGPNGAGKSTSFKMTCGIVRPDRGRVLLGEQDVTDWPLFRRASEGGMGYLAQESSVFKKLTVEQNVSSLLELLGVGHRERKKRTLELLEDFEITHIRRSKAGKLSGGERRRLEIARCLVSDPKIIMLDEPFAGIDPVTVQNIQQIIHRLRDRGIAILITDHAAREILETVDRCYVISKGSVLVEGEPDVVRSHPEVRKEYLGELAMHEIANTSPVIDARQQHTASTSSEAAPRSESHATAKQTRTPVPVPSQHSQQAARKSRSTPHDAPRHPGGREHGEPAWGQEDEQPLGVRVASVNAKPANAQSSSEASTTSSPAPRKTLLRRARRPKTDV